MKVLFVCPFVPWPLENGGKIRTFHLVREAARHVDVHLRVIREPDEVPGAREALAPHCASLEFFDRARPGALQRWRLPKLERWFHSPALRQAVLDDLARGGFDLVHLDELLLARVVPQALGVPVVQHHHKLDTVLYDTLSAGDGPHRHFDLWKLRRLESESTRRYRHHLFCSEGDAALMRERYGDLECGVVPSGFDPASFAPTSPAVGPVPGRLLFLGSMNYGPNIDGITRFVRETLPTIRAGEPRAHLEIVGAHPTREVRALADEHVTVTGRVDEVRPWLERAAAMVVPLRIGGGTRLKIVEALALGKPVVSTTIGAEGLDLVAGDHLELADEPQDFARATLALLTDPAHAARLGAAGRTFVHEHYRWDVLARRLVACWERAVQSWAPTSV